MIVGILLSENPVTSAEDPEAVQVKSVPVTLDVKVIFVALLLHCCLLLGVFDKSGVG